MKKALIFLSVFILMLIHTSCSSTYFLSIIESDSPNITQDQNNDFLIKKDSLLIAYRFNGADAPIHITIYNNSTTPLYVDWAKSSLIIDDEAISYSSDNLTLNTESNSSTTVSRYPYGYSYEETQITTTGHISIPKTVSFIPPHSKLSQVPAILNVNFNEIPKKHFIKARMGNKDNEVIEVMRINYNRDNTPLTFRSYLTLYFEGQKPIIIEDDFYIGKILSSNKISPKELPENMVNRGDLFYVGKPANTTVGDVILGSTIIVGAAVIDVLINADDNY